MPDVLTDVRVWLHTQQDWLQEAAECLLEQGTLSDDTIVRLCESLKTTDGQRVTPHRKFKYLGNPVATSVALRLVSIGKVKGIENLSPRTPLIFGKGNLTVVYGNNGSGKSSYTRILKKVCGKPRTQSLKPNVFQQPPPAIRQCAIVYSVDGNEQSKTWLANSADIPELESVDIFDGDAAGFYLSDETEVSYRPQVLALFERLASVCERMRSKLQYEQDQLVKKLPALPPAYTETSAGKTYRTLSQGMSEAALKPVIEWSHEDQNSLEHLTERLKTGNPLVLAKQKQAKKRQIDEILSAISNAAKAVSEKACKRLQVLGRLAGEKRRQATEAASANTSSAKLGGIGTDTWIALWEAAKAYSMETAYPDRGYPFTEDDARCVLCHQILGVEAKIRLQDFEAYVQSKMESEAKQAEEAYRRSIEALPGSPSEQQLQASCQAAGLNEENWLEQVSGFWKKFGAIRDRCKTAGLTEDIRGLQEPTELSTALRQLSDTLEAEAAQHSADATAFDRTQATKQKVELEAKRWTTQQAVAILAEVLRLSQVSDFENWKGLANSRNVSRKAGEISERVITNAYVTRFNKELEALGASQIKVELVKTRTERGKVKHRIQLRGVTVDDHRPVSVLSDGERRVVALAAFLADVTGKPQKAPFVFDDPISSLDQDFEWKVAVRLSILAKDRQVLVFTHRLPLYGALEDAARKCGEDWKGKNLLQLCIEVFGGTAGHPVDEAFWNSNTKKANNILINRLDDAEKILDSGNSVNYTVHVQGICTDFRKLLERTVEEDLLYQIVKRHRRSVTTDGRIAQLPKITREDCALIDDLMTKYSCYEHSQSDEAPVFLPDEPELRRDIETLKEWREEFKKRPVEVVP